MLVCCVFSNRFLCNEYKKSDLEDFSEELDTKPKLIVAQFSSEELTTKE